MKNESTLTYVLTVNDLIDDGLTFQTEGSTVLEAFATMLIATPFVWPDFDEYGGGTTAPYPVTPEQSHTNREALLSFLLELSHAKKGGQFLPGSRRDRNLEIRLHIKDRSLSTSTPVES